MVFQGEHQPAVLGPVGPEARSGMRKGSELEAELSQDNLPAWVEVLRSMVVDQAQWAWEAGSGLEGEGEALLKSEEQRLRSHPVVNVSKRLITV